MALVSFPQLAGCGKHFAFLAVATFRAQTRFVGKSFLSFELILVGVYFFIINFQRCPVLFLMVASLLRLGKYRLGLNRGVLSCL